jgi:fructokinase
LITGKTTLDIEGVRVREMEAPILGGIEAGGTKFVCAVGNAPQNILAEIRFPTTTVEATLGRAIDFFRKQQTLHSKLLAIGIAAFGPLDPNPMSPSFGHITSTPKPGWQNADILGPIRQAFPVAIGFDTDVNGAALGEHRWGAAQGLDTFLYITVGTGIGGGGMLGGTLMHGMLHPEMGHVRLPHDWQADPFAGVCPYHGDCLEGLATGPAIAARWGQPAENLPPDHPAWKLEASYLALAIANLVCTLSPQRIILGGGVMKQSILFPAIRSKVQELLNGYVHTSQILEQIQEYIVPPRLGSRAGVLGAIALAERSLI